MVKRGQDDWKEKITNCIETQEEHPHAETWQQGQGAQPGFTKHTDRWGGDCQKLFCWQKRLVLTVLNKMAELRASDWLCPNTLLLILEGHRWQWEESPEQHGNEIKSWLVFRAQMSVQTAVQSIYIPYAIF